MNTLGLDDDLDGCELATAVEGAFAIAMSDTEAERVVTVGDLNDLLLQRIPEDVRDRKCATAMAFYRLAKALRQLGHGTDWRPTTKLQALEVRGPKESFERLEEITGLRLPTPEITRRGYCLYVVSMSSALAFGLLLAFQHRAGMHVALLACLLSWAAARRDRGKLPRDCATLGDLARQTAVCSYGRLIAMGASHRPADIWKNLCALLSRYGLPTAEIRKDTFLLQSQLDKALRPSTNP